MRNYCFENRDSQIHPSGRSRTVEDSETDLTLYTSTQHSAALCLAKQIQLYTDSLPTHKSAIIPATTAIKPVSAMLFILTAIEV